MNGRRPHGGGNEPSAMPFKLKTIPRTMTATTNELPRLAVFIDAENVGNPSHIDFVFDTIAARNIGTPVVKKAYGNFEEREPSWRDPWIEQCQRLGIEIVPQKHFVRGKSSADVKMVVDAVKTRMRKSKNKIGSYCFVSSDTDFRPLVEFITKGNCTAYGFGKENTSPALRDVFDDGYFSFEQIKKQFQDICDMTANILGESKNHSLGYDDLNIKLREQLGGQIVPDRFFTKYVLKNDVRFNIVKNNDSVILRSEQEITVLSTVRSILAGNENRDEWIPLTTIGQIVRNSVSLPHSFRLLSTLKTDPLWFEIITNEDETSFCVRLLNNRSVAPTENK